MYLQDDGELLRGVPVLHPHRQPHLKGRQLLRKERAVLWTEHINKVFIVTTNIYLNLNATPGPRAAAAPAESPDCGELIISYQRVDTEC